MRVQLSVAMKTAASPLGDLSNSQFHLPISFMDETDVIALLPFNVVEETVVASIQKVIGLSAFYSRLTLHASCWGIYFA